MLRTLKEVLTNRRELREQPLPQAHFVERHWILAKGSWEDGVRQLQAAFPRDTRPDRPAPWFQALAATHSPGLVPPGNGPFFVPDWAMEGAPPADVTVWESTLKRAGFRPMVAHCAYLPDNTEYLVRAMQIAGPKLPWTVNPWTYRVYCYPRISGRPGPLRPYTTRRWIPG